MAQIKAAEVSAILKKQLANFDESISLEEVGTHQSLLIAF